MGIFGKKEDIRYIKDFDVALENINEFSKQFRELHFQSLATFEKNFQKEKSPDDLTKERQLFESHLEVLQKLKFNSDTLLSEALKIVRNETALTEKDRDDLHKILEPRERTKIPMPGKGK